jgi:hypothetical protein
MTIVTLAVFATGSVLAAKAIRFGRINRLPGFARIGG